MPPIEPVSVSPSPLSAHVIAANVKPGPCRRLARRKVKLDARNRVRAGREHKSARLDVNRIRIAGFAAGVAAGRRAVRKILLVNNQRQRPVLVGGAPSVMLIVCVSVSTSPSASVTVAVKLNDGLPLESGDGLNVHVAVPPAVIASSERQARRRQASPSQTCSAPRRPS